MPQKWTPILLSDAEKTLGRVQGFEEPAALAHELAMAKEKCEAPDGLMYYQWEKKRQELFDRFQLAAHIHAKIVTLERKQADSGGHEQEQEQEHAEHSLIKPAMSKRTARRYCI